MAHPQARAASSPSTKIPDLNSGFRAFRTDVARQYLHQLPAGFSCVTTITMTFLANGYSVKYIPIEYAKRAGRVEVPLVQGHAALRTQVVRMILSYNPLRDLHAGRARALGARLRQARLRHDRQATSTSPTNTLLILFAAFQVIAIGLLADLVVRVTKPDTEVEPATK